VIERRIWETLTTSYVAETITDSIAGPVPKKDPVNSGHSTRLHSAGAPSLVRAGGRPAEVVAFEESVTEFFLEAAVLLGIPKSVATIYGICFASAEPLSFSDVRNRVDLSAGSISQGIRILREVGALKVVTAPLDRREFFTPDMELRKLILRYVEQRVEKQLSSGRGRLQAVAKSIPPGGNESGTTLRDRLNALQGWHNKARSLVPIVKAAVKLT
jgi:DNA-binding transcriptional regulator GbsR (MarR family)